MNVEIYEFFLPSRIKVVFICYCIHNIFAIKGTTQIAKRKVKESQVHVEKYVAFFISNEKIDSVFFLCIFINCLKTFV